MHLKEKYGFYGRIINLSWYNVTDKVKNIKENNQ